MTPSGEAAGQVAQRELSAAAEARLFWQLRGSLLRTLSRQTLSRNRLQVLTVVLASTVMWLALFLLFFEAFFFVRNTLVHAGMRAQFFHAIFNIFFLALTVMLVFSSAIILYGNLFQSQEVQFLLTTPARPQRIVLHKFHEAVFFSCWGFLLLGSPMLIAYGVMTDSPWYYFALLPPFMVSFVVIPAAVGGLACLAIVRLMPAVRLHALVVVGGAVLLVGVGLLWRLLLADNRDLMTPTWFQDVVARLQFSEQRLLPSWWLSSGLLEAAHAAPGQTEPSPLQESLWFLAVLATNAAMLRLALLQTAARWFRLGYSELQGLTHARRRRQLGWLARAENRLATLLPTELGTFMVKDLRMFRRDPVQWSQIVIFFSLLLFYFFNVRRFDYAGSLVQWVTIISFLNLAVVGLILSTFTTRFIFPMISLEGRRFWILATAPIRRDLILWSKFWLAFGGAWPVCAVLVLISDLTLGIVSRLPLVALIHQVTIGLICLGLAALAVGLGARLPNLRETSPSRIAAGFGGTINLVLSALYITTLVAVTSVPAFCWAEGSLLLEQDVPGSWLFHSGYGLGSSGLVAGGLLVAVALGALTTYLPLRVGIRAFRELEG